MKTFFAEIGDTKGVSASIPRRAFVSVLVQSILATTLMRQCSGQSEQFYTPPRDLAQHWQFIPNSALPNILLIGDSISLGYTIDVREMLYGKANVYRPMVGAGRPDNCGNTAYGLRRIDDWLGQTKWAVIHFNWGLWDLCYRNSQSRIQGRRDKIHGVQDVPIEEYRENLSKLVDILESTGAKLIWATTTVVPADEAGRFVGDEVKYNQVANKIMQSHHVQMDDLYSLTAHFPASEFAGLGNVHYRPEAYRRIARQVASAVQAALGEIARPAED